MFVLLIRSSEGSHSRFAIFTSFLADTQKSLIQEFLNPSIPQFLNPKWVYNTNSGDFQKKSRQIIPLGNPVWLGL
jgi:hypothetical protein